MKASLGMIAAATLALGACGHDDEDSGGVTPEESRQLDEAAKMLDDAPNALTPPDETGLDNQVDAPDSGDSADSNDTDDAQPR